MLLLYSNFIIDTKASLTKHTKNLNFSLSIELQIISLTLDKFCRFGILKSLEQQNEDLSPILVD